MYKLVYKHSQGACSFSKGQAQFHVSLAWLLWNNKAICRSRTRHHRWSGELPVSWYMCACVCMHVHLCVNVYMCVYALYVLATTDEAVNFLSLYMCACVCMHVHLCACVYICTLRTRHHACGGKLRVSWYMCACVCRNVHMCVKVYVYWWHVHWYVCRGSHSVSQDKIWHEKLLLIMGCTLEPWMILFVFYPKPGIIFSQEYWWLICIFCRHKDEEPKTAEGAALRFRCSKRGARCSHQKCFLQPKGSELQAWRLAVRATIMREACEQETWTTLVLRLGFLTCCSRHADALTKGRMHEEMQLDTGWMSRVWGAVVWFMYDICVSIIFNWLSISCRDHDILFNLGEVALETCILTRLPSSCLAWRSPFRAASGVRCDVRASPYVCAFVIHVFISRLVLFISTCGEPRVQTLQSEGSINSDKKWRTMFAQPHVEFGNTLPTWDSHTCWDQLTDSMCLLSLLRLVRVGWRRKQLSSDSAVKKCPVTRTFFVRYARNS